MFYSIILQGYIIASDSLAVGREIGGGRVRGGAFVDDGWNRYLELIHEG